MRSGSFLKDLKELNQYLYDSPNKDFKSWKLIDSYADKTGVLIELFQADSEYILAIKGTDVNYSSLKNTKDSISDFISDIEIYLNKLPEQYKPVKEYYSKIKDNYSKLLLTGYSLGGSLVQMLGNETGLETITFAAIGTASLLSPKHTSNILNYGNTLDCFFIANIGEQVGKIYVMPITSKKEIYPVGMPNPWFHMYKNYGNPANAEVYKPIKNRVKDYLKDGIIPTVQDKINSLKP